MSKRLFALSGRYLYDVFTEPKLSDVAAKHRLKRILLVPTYLTLR